MKKKNYISYVCTKLILWLIISALLTLGFGGLSYIEYDRYVNGLKNGQDEGNLTYYIVSRYLSCALRNDPRINLYKSNMKVVPDYEFFAKIKDDGSLDTIYKTDYDDIYFENNDYSETASFETIIDPDRYTHDEYVDDEGIIWPFYIELFSDEEMTPLEQKRAKDKYLADYEKKHDGRKLKPLYYYKENRITSDYANKVHWPKKIIDVRMSGEEPWKTEVILFYEYCLDRTVLDEYMNRSHDLKRRQHTHALIADKVLPWLNTNKTDEEGFSLINPILCKYTDLYDDDLKTDNVVNSTVFELNDKKYKVKDIKSEYETAYTIPYVCQKPEKLLSRYKHILEPEKIVIGNSYIDSIFESDDKEANVFMDYGFGARFSNNYSYNYGYLMQYGVVRTLEGDYYYAFATPLAGFWETEGCIISVFFMVIFAAGFVLINLLSVFPYLRYVNRYNNTVFKAGLIDALAHNLKTPMQIISVNAENIKDTDSSKEKDDLADIILSQTDSVNNMVERILKAADRKAVKTVFETREVVEQIAKKIGAEVVINGTQKIHSDREFFEQAIYNLIDNAGKYRSEGDIIVDIKRHGLEIVNKCGSDKFTPGAGIAIADRFLIQNGMNLKLRLKNGNFIAYIRF